MRQRAKNSNGAGKSIFSAKKNLLAGATLIGTIVGAGVFGIPYVFSRSGLLPSLFYFIAIGIVVTYLHLFFGEIVLRTREEHRLVGYAQKYLGQKAKILTALEITVGVVGSLLVYIILAGHFLTIIFPSSLAAVQFSIIFWAGLSLFIFLGIRPIAVVEFLMGTILFGSVLIIFLFCLPKIETSNLFLVNAKNIFLPFGVFLFSLVGWSAVPEIEDILERKKDLKKVIVVTTALCVVFYILFGLIVSGVTGRLTTQEAFGGLIPFLGHKIMVLGGIFGLLAVATSFLTLGNYLKNTFIFDFRFPRILGFLLACCLPLVLFLLGWREFIGIISVLGVFIGLVEGTIIVLTYRRARKMGDRASEYALKIPNFCLYIIIAVLVGGAIAQIIYG